MSVLYGIGPGNVKKPLKVTADGSLVLTNVSQVVYMDGSKTLSSTTAINDLPVGAFTQLSVDVTVESNTGTAELWIAVDRKGADGKYYLLGTTSNITDGSGQRSMSIGVGLAINAAFGDFIRIRQGIDGSGTITRTISVIGK